MFGITAKLDVHLAPDDILASLGLDEFGRVQQAIDQTVIDYCRPYTPASPDRTLEFSAQASTRIGSGTVVWNTPYAHYQYMGIVYGAAVALPSPLELAGQFSPKGRKRPDRNRRFSGRPPAIPIIEDGVLMGWFSPPGRPKHPTDRELTYDTSQNPLAGPYWFERMRRQQALWGLLVGPLGPTADVGNRRLTDAAPRDRLNDILETARKAVKGG